MLWKNIMLVKNGTIDINGRKEKDMKQLLLTVLGASIANILTWAIYQGFTKSYWGKNVREEMTRFFDNIRKYLRALKKRGK